MPAELKAMIPPLTQTIGSTKQDTSNIKQTTGIITTTTALPGGNASPAPAPALQRAVSWARVAATQAIPPQLAQTIPSSTSATERDRMVIIKIRDPDISSHLRSQKPKELKNIMNSALKEQTNINTQQVRVVAAKQLKSGDIAVYTTTGKERGILQQFTEDWVRVWGKEAQVAVPTYDVLVHGVQTKSMDLAHMTKAMRLLQAENAPRMPRAEIKYIGWLTKREDFGSYQPIAAAQDELFDWTEKMLIKDGGVRWNSTYLMLKRAKLLRRAIELFQKDHNELEDDEDGGYSVGEDRLTKDDWEEIDRFLLILEPITFATKYLEGNPGVSEFGSLWAIFPALNMLSEQIDLAINDTKDEPESYFKSGILMGKQKLDRY
ncbi:hypothetical protein B0A49_13259 [Cryomyces minteri]|uniref:Uncharacterized protein n=1 Tax=Cryomyces minteri TaxID=331657 RepID=A0A4U0WIB3_9PEZI|nr:hypothetical protein B0A49_13259 [Cryomyces minteri]